MNNQIIHKNVILKMQIAENTYQICSLGFHMGVKNEFFYNFLYPSKIKKKFFNYNTQSQTGRPCHISWHEDGKVHLMLKKDKKTSVYQIPDKTFLPKNSNAITPLFVHSVYSDKSKYWLPLESTTESIKNSNCSKMLFKSENPVNFSIVLFLASESLNLNELLNGLWLDVSYQNTKLKHRLYSSLLYCKDYKSMKILAWEGWAIHVLITDLHIKVPTNKKNLPNPYFSSFAYCDLHLLLKDFLIQRINQNS